MVLRSAVLRSALLIAMLLASLLTPAVGSAQTDPPLPIRFNAGSNQGFTDHNGNFYLPDLPWQPGAPAGYIGGYPAPPGMTYPVGGTVDEPLYRTQRRNWSEYRVSQIPNGGYLVTLRFNEQRVHGPDFCVFDVRIENQTVLDDFDLFDWVGKDYAFTRRFAVTVSDGELNVVAVPVTGEPHLSAIAVEPRSPDTVAPGVPAGLTARGSYSAILLDWNDNEEADLNGYHVYRAEASGGPYTRLTTDHPAYESRYRDTTATPYLTYYYRLSAVDVYGNESGQGPTQSATSLFWEQATLPFYQLDVSPEHLAILYTNPDASTMVTGTLFYSGQVYPVEVRFRGNVTRRFSKKSWKIDFTADSPLPNQDKIAVNADMVDWSMMRGRLTAGLFEASGIRPPQAEPVLLSLNGEYYGVYTRYERIDEGFLERTGRDPGTSIYKSNRDLMMALPNEQAYRQAYDKETNQDLGYGDLISFVGLVNNTPDEAFAGELSQAFDVASYLNYYAIIVLTSNTDFTTHNAYLLHDLTTDRWELVPWDLDHTFGISGAFDRIIEYDYPIDMGTYNSPGVIGGPNILLSRVLDVPQFRAYYCHRLAALMDTSFSDSTFYPQVDSTYATIEADGMRDWRKFGWEGTGWFTAAPGELKTFATERKNFLRGAMPAYCPADQLYLKVNEFMADNATTLCDPDDPDPNGCYDDWFEIYNAGLEPVSLQGLYLTNDLANPTKFQITQPITIPALGFVLFWADNEPTQGSNHTNFTLAAGGEAIALFAADGTTMLDGFPFGPQTTDISQGRYPNGSVNQMLFWTPTPGSSNTLFGPVISDTTRTPTWPTMADPVLVTATITDDGILVTHTLYYNVAGGNFIGVPMAAQGGDVYAATIPAQANGVLVRYYLLAVDDNIQVTTDPTAAPPNTYAYQVGYQLPALYINEFMANNNTFLQDPDEPGEYPDWIELYNAGSAPINLGGKYLTDDLSQPTQFRITDSVSLPAGGWIIFYADGEPEQGPYHTNFALDRNGESIGLFDVDASGNASVDLYAFGPQSPDDSAGRCPDASANWLVFSSATPGTANGPCTAPPVISGTTHIPQLPGATDTVTVTSVITDDSGLLTATMYYSAGAGFVGVPMAPQGGDLYAATIPPYPAGTLVAYYVQATDDGRFMVYDPPTAPAATYRYLVGYQAPLLYVNEFMADNETFMQDPDEPGEYPDWIELYNAGAITVNLGGMYLTDDPNQPTQFRITDGLSLPAGAWVVFYADGEPAQGPYHTNFALSRSGESVGLFDVDSIGNPPIDVYTFGPQNPNVSTGRCPDGSSSWLLLWGTPGMANSPCSAPPIISGTNHLPQLPGDTDPVVVTSVITDDSGLLTATLYYSAGAGFAGVPMVAQGGDLYAGTIPPQPAGTRVAYYVQATDGQLTVVDPPTAPAGSYRYQVSYQAPLLYINEFMADNGTFMQDPDEPGEYPDWIELYNAGTTPVNLGGMYLTDDPNQPTQFRITDGLSLPAGGWVIFYADGEPAQGPYHTNFALSKAGETIGLFDVDGNGNPPIDVYTFGPQNPDISTGRCPDAGATWIVFPIATPGATNAPCSAPPVISGTAHLPQLPGESDTVTVSATITDDGIVVAATLYYSAGASFVGVPMVAQGGDLYAATIPPQPVGTWVSYYLQATDDGGFTVTDPPTAPAATYRYQVGYQVPLLYINEFMADNDTFLQDPDEPGEFPDWIELYNAGPTAVDLGGLYLTDDLAVPTQFRITDGLSLPAGAWVVFYADGEPAQGPYHTNFALSRTGESIGLFDGTGSVQIDAVTFITQTADISWGRYPDAMPDWSFMNCPTPGRSNLLACQRVYLPLIVK